MNEEMKSLQKNETWELVDCSLGNKPVGYHWIHTMKYKKNGSIERYKARLVTKGYTQTYGIMGLWVDRETRTSRCQPFDTQIEEGMKLWVEHNQIPTDKGRYQIIVGRLMHLALTRLDLAYALSVVSQYMHNPREQHMNVIIHILRYLKGAPRKLIMFTEHANH